MPRRNNRDRRFEPKEYGSNTGHFQMSEEDTPVRNGKPRRKRKDKWDKKIYTEGE